MLRREGTASDRKPTKHLSVASLGRQRRKHPNSCLLHGEPSTRDPTSSAARKHPARRACREAHMDACAAPAAERFATTTAAAAAEAATVSATAGVLRGRPPPEVGPSFGEVVGSCKSAAKRCCPPKAAPLRSLALGSLVETDPSCAANWRRLVGVREEITAALGFKAFCFFALPFFWRDDCCRPC